MRRSSATSFSREPSASSIHRARKRPSRSAGAPAGIRVIMITGDHPRTALRIAQDLGIIQPAAVPYRGRTRSPRRCRIHRGRAHNVVYARVAPQHKLDRRRAAGPGHVVAMTGDGVNDAPALKSADMGIAMGVTGTEVTKQAARMILADDNFATIVAACVKAAAFRKHPGVPALPAFIEHGRGADRVSRCRAGGCHGSRGAGGEAVVLPLLATQILWINLITDSGPRSRWVSIHTEDTIGREPRRLTERVIDAAMWAGSSKLASRWP